MQSQRQSRDAFSSVQAHCIQGTIQAITMRHWPDDWNIQYINCSVATKMCHYICDYNSGVCWSYFYICCTIGKKNEYSTIYLLSGIIILSHRTQESLGVIHRVSYFWKLYVLSFEDKMLIINPWESWYYLKIPHKNWTRQSLDDFNNWQIAGSCQLFSMSPLVWAGIMKIFRMNFVHFVTPLGSIHSSFFCYKKYVSSLSFWATLWGS